MTPKRVSLVVLSAGVLALAVLFANVLRADAQMSREGGPRAPGAVKEQPPRDVTLEGRIVDLQCVMTGKYPSADQAKCTADCIRAGVPAGLETETGLVVLGQGTTGPVKALMPLAFQQVEARGKLYEKGGLKYLDITSIKVIEEEEEEEEEEYPED